jgi:catechol 2,3-dioxygenase-like lactoylglutathione lyase family enzyme
VVIGFPPGTGPLLPTGNVRDVIDGAEVTCVDNGMPTVLIAASSLRVTGYETPKDLGLADRLRGIRLAAGRLMGLGDVSGTTVPKLTLLAPPRHGGAVTTRTFIPVRCHTSIGVLGAASVAAGLRIDGGAGEGIARLPEQGDRVRIEHPTGFLDIASTLGSTPDGLPCARRAGPDTRTPPWRPPMTPPLGDIAHIGHAQLFTPDLDASVAFFTDYLGLTVNGQQGDTVYLRTFDDYEHHSLVLTARHRDQHGLRLRPAPTRPARSPPAARRARQGGRRRPLDQPARPLPRRCVGADPAVLAGFLRRPPSAASSWSTASPPGCPP